MKFAVVLVLVFLWCDNGIAIRTKLTLSREKRGDPCSFSKLFTMEKSKDNQYMVNLSPGLVDRLLVHNFDWDQVCNDNKIRDLETSNRIYYINHEEGEKSKRSLGDQSRHKRSADLSMRPRAADRVRLIERLAVQIDQLDHKIQFATQKLNMDAIKADRELFLIYKSRLQTLLKSKLQLAIKENKVILDSMEHINLPKQFHR